MADERVDAKAVLEASAIPGNSFAVTGLRLCRWCNGVWPFHIGACPIPALGQTLTDLDTMTTCRDHWKNSYHDVRKDSAALWGRRTPMPERVDAKAVLDGEWHQGLRKENCMGCGEIGPQHAEWCRVAPLYDALRQTLADLQAVSAVGHDDDCLFCGFKDAIVRDAVAGKCEHCGVSAGQVHGVTCPNLPRGMFGSLAPEISTGPKEPE